MIWKFIIRFIENGYKWFIKSLSKVAGKLITFTLVLVTDKQVCASIRIRKLIWYVSQRLLGVKKVQHKVEDIKEMHLLIKQL